MFLQAQLKGANWYNPWLPSSGTSKLDPFDLDPGSSLGTRMGDISTHHLRDEWCSAWLAALKFMNLCHKQGKVGYVDIHHNFPSGGLWTIPIMDMQQYLDTGWDDTITYPLLNTPEEQAWFVGTDWMQCPGGNQSNDLQGYFEQGEIIGNTLSGLSASEKTEFYLSLGTRLAQNGGFLPPLWLVNVAMDFSYTPMGFGPTRTRRQGANPTDMHMVVQPLLFAQESRFSFQRDVSIPVMCNRGITSHNDITERYKIPIDVITGTVEYYSLKHEHCGILANSQVPSDQTGTRIHIANPALVANCYHPRASWQSLVNLVFTQGVPDPSAFQETYGLDISFGGFNAGAGTNFSLNWNRDPGNFVEQLLNFNTPVDLDGRGCTGSGDYSVEGAGDCIQPTETYFMSVPISTQVIALPIYGPAKTDMFEIIGGDPWCLSVIPIRNEFTRKWLKDNHTWTTTTPTNSGGLTTWTFETPPLNRTDINGLVVSDLAVLLGEELHEKAHHNIYGGPEYVLDSDRSGFLLVPPVWMDHSTDIFHLPLEPVDSLGTWPVDMVGPARLSVKMGPSMNTGLGIIGGHSQTYGMDPVDLLESASKHWHAHSWILPRTGTPMHAVETSFPRTSTQMQGLGNVFSTLENLKWDGTSFWQVTPLMNEYYEIDNAEFANVATRVYYVGAYGAFPSTTQHEVGWHVQDANMVPMVPSTNQPVRTLTLLEVGGALEAGGLALGFEDLRLFSELDSRAADTTVPNNWGGPKLGSPKAGAASFPICKLHGEYQGLILTVTPSQVLP